MSIINAKRFIQRIDRDEELRDLLNKTNDIVLRKKIIEDEGFIFNMKAFQEAYASMLFLSINAEQENRIRQLGEWCKTVNLH